MAIPRHANRHHRSKTHVQTLIFSKDHWTKLEAQAWARQMGYHNGVDEKENTYRMRQYPPSLFVSTSFRTIDFGEPQKGIKAVIGHFKASTVHKHPHYR